MHACLVAACHRFAVKAAPLLDACEAAHSCGWTDARLLQVQACLPHGDLDLGYQMHGAMFGQGAYLMLRHEQESVAAANAPVSSVYSGVLAVLCLVLKGWTLFWPTDCK